MPKVCIVGSGIGGLCTGIRLLHKGYQVSLFEKNSKIGGVIEYVESSDKRFKIDKSASLAINSLTYSEIFTDLGYRPGNYFEYTPLDNNYKVFSQVYTPFNLAINLVKTQKSLKVVFEEDVEGYTQFVYQSSLKYLKAKEYLLNKSYIKLGDIYNLETLKTILNLHTFNSAYKMVSRYVESSYIKEIILFQTFFMGVSPYKIPSIYTAIAAQTQIEGMYHIKGGLAGYVLALERLFKELGGKIHCNALVEEVVSNSNTAKAILCGGRVVPADIVILNTDYLYSQYVLLKRSNMRKYKLSCSTFIIHLGLSTTFDVLEVHNLYIAKNFKQEIENVFKGVLPTTPSLYIYYPSCKDKSFCKNRHESVMNIMVRVPNLQDLYEEWGEEVKERLFQICINTIIKIKGLEKLKKNIVFRQLTTPLHFQDNYNYYQGSCFGLAHTFFQSMSFRPQIKDKELKNLYYVGGSIHPGNGASIVMDCAKILANKISEEHSFEYS